MTILSSSFVSISISFLGNGLLVLSAALLGPSPGEALREFEEPERFRELEYWELWMAVWAAE